MGWVLYVAGSRLAKRLAARVWKNRGGGAADWFRRSVISEAIQGWRALLIRRRRVDVVWVQLLMDKI